MTSLNPRKIFVVSLPRTGTTTLCHLFLQQGYKVAHTAYTQACCEHADVLADTPIYADYARLQTTIPASCWILLQRPVQDWLPSIRFLLQQLSAQPQEKFQPLFWQSMSKVFGEQFLQASDEHLLRCYQQHQQHVVEQSKKLDVPLLQITLEAGEQDANSLLQKYLAEPSDCHFDLQTPVQLNNQRVFAWGESKHPLKVSSHLSGARGRKYFWPV